MSLKDIIINNDDYKNVKIELNIVRKNPTITIDFSAILDDMDYIYANKIKFITKHYNSGWNNLLKTHTYTTPRGLKEEEKEKIINEIINLTKEYSHEFYNETKNSMELYYKDLNDNIRIETNLFDIYCNENKEMELKIKSFLGKDMFLEIIKKVKKINENTFKINKFKYEELKNIAIELNNKINTNDIDEYLMDVKNDFKFDIDLFFIYTENNKIFLKSKKRWEENVFKEIIPKLIKTDNKKIYEITKNNYKEFKEYINLLKKVEENETQKRKLNFKEFFHDIEILEDNILDLKIKVNKDLGLFEFSAIGDTIALNDLFHGFSPKKTPLSFLSLNEILLFKNNKDLEFVDVDDKIINMKFFKKDKGIYYLNFEEYEKLKEIKLNYEKLKEIMTKKPIKLDVSIMKNEYFKNNLSIYISDKGESFLVINVSKSKIMAIKINNKEFDYFMKDAPYALELKEYSKNFNYAINSIRTISSEELWLKKMEIYDISKNIINSNVKNTKNKL